MVMVSVQSGFLLEMSIYTSYCVCYDLPTTGVGGIELNSWCLYSSTSPLPLSVTSGARHKHNAIESLIKDTGKRMDSLCMSI